MTFCLNPYSNGRYSERQDVARAYISELEVLILILMEDTLRVDENELDAFGMPGLNPYSNGRYSESYMHKTCRA